MSSNSIIKIKQQNILQIKRALIALGSATKPEIAKHTGLTVATCGNLLNEMAKSGDAVAENLRFSNGGRPAQTYRYCAEKTQFLSLLAISENGTEKIYYRVVDVAEKTHSQGSSLVRQVNLPTLKKMAMGILKKNPAIRLVTLGVQGCVHEGIVAFSDFPELDGRALQSELESALKIPVFVENDMNSIALGYSRVNQNEKDIAILFFPKGNPPAGGFLVDGNIVRGHSSLSGELSYFPFPFPKGSQRRFFDNAKRALPGILQVVQATIVFFDPAVILLTGCLSEDLKKLNFEKRLQMRFAKSKLPKLLIQPNTQEEYFAGIAQLSIQRLLKI